MLCVLGKGTSILVFGNAIGLDIFGADLGSLGEVALIDNRGAQRRGAEGRDSQVSLSVCGGNMQAANAFWDGIRVYRSRHQLDWTWMGTGEFSIIMKHVLLISATHMRPCVNLCSYSIWIIVHWTLCLV